LARLASGQGSVYRTGDGEFEIKIFDSPYHRDGETRREIIFARRLPDPTPANVFDDYREVRNSFGISYGFDTNSRAESSVDIPLLRTALLSFVDSTLQGRIIAGEK